MGEASVPPSQPPGSRVARSTSHPQHSLEGNYPSPKSMRQANQELPRRKLSTWVRRASEVKALHRKASEVKAKTQVIHWRAKAQVIHWRAKAKAKAHIIHHRTEAKAQAQVVHHRGRLGLSPSRPGCYCFRSETKGYVHIGIPHPVMLVYS